MYATLTGLRALVREDVLLNLVDDEGTGELEDFTLDPPGPQRTRLDQALKAANDEVDSYLAGRYALPLTTVPDVLAAKALDVAHYHLWARRGLRLDTADELISKRYDDAVKWLRAIVRGEVSLPLPPDPTDPDAGSTGALAVVSRPPRGW